MAKPVQVTVSSPTNIAVIKYWGKRDAKTNTPINSSVSITINQRDLRTVTTVTASKDFEKDRLWLNGTEESVAENKRVLAVFREVRALARDRVDPKTGEVVVKAEEWASMRVYVVSANNFPTAAGLASSAAGYAALTSALAELHCVQESYPGQLSGIARQGSGSACRSLHGGFVAWDMGEKADGSDSVARQVAPAEHWPELDVLILVVSDAKKTVSSTSGMDTSVKTSKLLAHRAASVVPERMVRMEEAYLARDFAAFAQLAMADSNQFHSTCLDTYPPIFYMNDVSRAVIQVVHAFNSACGEVRAGYTFDAGPNAVLLTRKDHTAQLLAAVLAYFPPSAEAEADFVNDASLRAKAAKAGPPEGLAALLAKMAPLKGMVKKVYHTDVGPGAHPLDDTQSLATADGLPRDAGPAAAGGATWGKQLACALALGYPLARIGGALMGK